MQRLLPFLVVAVLTAPAHADPIGSVDTVFKFIGPDHKIVVDAYEDPKVAGVGCYVSRAKTGSIKGALGVAEGKSEASIACCQVGPISVPQPLPVQKEVFNERISLVAEVSNGWIVQLEMTTMREVAAS